MSSIFHGNELSGPIKNYCTSLLPKKHLIIRILITFQKVILIYNDAPIYLNLNKVTREKFIIRKRHKEI